jgi:transcription initiation factor TFIIB
MKTIYRTFGFAFFRDKIVTKQMIIDRFGPPNEEIPHNSYSVQMKYKELGIDFYYLTPTPLTDNLPSIPTDIPKKKTESLIISIAFEAPYPGKTEEGIILNRSTMEEVFRMLGNEILLTADDYPYWWADYSGISFYIHRDLSQKPFPFNEQEYLHQQIVRISVPVFPLDEDYAHTPEGLLIRSVEDYCIDGNPHEIIYDEGRAEIICSKCGMVQSERMISVEFSGERAFSKDEQEKRQTHGSPMNPLIPDMQLATMIDKRATMPEGLRKAVKWDSRYSWKQRNMIQATSEIKRIGELMNLPQHVKVYAIKLYRKAFTLGLLKGRSIRAMVAATIYYACGAEKVPRTLQNIVNVSDSSFHQITKCYQSLIKALRLQSPTISPKDLVSNYISLLNLPHNVEIMAGKILENYEHKYTLSGKDPKGLLAAALYVAAQRYKLKISQTKISRIVGITEVTLRNRLREIQRILKKPDKFHNDQ